MKSILITIKPEQVAKILNYEKTIEIRKTKPKCESPINVYIYCAKNGKFLQEELDDVDSSGRWDYRTGDYALLPNEDKTRQHDKPLNGKVVAKFTLYKVERVVSCIVHDWGDDPWDMRYALRLEESDTKHCEDQLINEGGFEYLNTVCDYLGFDFPINHSGFATRPDFKEGVAYGYAWRISDLEIFDTPIELKRFRRIVPDNGKYSSCFKCKRFGSGCSSCNLTKAPQSWCYVEVEE